MRQQFGDFDETFILTQLAAGRDPDSAIKMYHNTIQREVDKRRAPNAPNVISGSSQGPIKVPLDTPDQRSNALVAALKGLGLGQ
jgi:hypothetical protein